MNSGRSLIRTRSRATVEDLPSGSASVVVVCDVAIAILRNYITGPHRQF